MGNISNEQIADIAIRVQSLFDLGMRQHFEDAVSRFIKSVPVSTEAAEEKTHAPKALAKRNRNKGLEEAKDEIPTDSLPFHLIPTLLQVDSQDQKLVVLAAVFCYANNESWHRPKVELRYTEKRRDPRYVGDKPDLKQHLRYEVWNDFNVKVVPEMDETKYQRLLQFLGDAEKSLGIASQMRGPKVNKATADEEQAIFDRYQEIRGMEKDITRAEFARSVDMTEKEFKRLYDRVHKRQTSK